MTRKIHQLTAVKVSKTKAPGYHADGGGLYLQVSAALTKSWIFRFTRNGKTREMGLGSIATYGLEEARERARKQRQIVEDGQDPIDARDAQRAQEALQKANSLSFAQCAKQYIAAHRSGWRNPKHADQWTATIETYAGPVIGELPVQAVETAHLMRILEPLWTTKHETASRLRGRVEHILDWATVHKYRTGDNPARWKGHLQKLLAKVKRKDRVEHHPALPYSAIGAFMEQLRAQEGTPARALEFCILTAARTGAVINAKPGEVAGAVWTVPAEHMKAECEHRVPLTPRALEILEALPAGEHLFRGRYDDQPMSNMAMMEVLRRMGRGDITVHGFRSTFKDWAAECTNYPNIVSEMALAHTISSEVEAAYRRGDLFEKRRKLMLDWAKHCDAPKQAAKVLPMRRARKKKAQREQFGKWLTENEGKVITTPCGSTRIGEVKAGRMVWDKPDQEQPAAKVLPMRKKAS